MDLGWNRGTPQFRLPELENDSFIFTLKVPSVKYDLNHEITCSEKFRCTIFCRRILWSIVSKAFVSL